MHIYFSGIGGTGIGPLALVANKAGHKISGSDKQGSNYIDYLRSQGIDDIHIGQDLSNISKVHQISPIDWFVYSSAVIIEDQQAPELVFCRTNQIRMSKRDELLNQIIQSQGTKLIAAAGTHGKTTTTAMAVWTMKQLGIPIGYILPAKSKFAQMGDIEPGAKYFVYECDEYDRNFLSFNPHLSLITGIGWDHADIFPTREDYYAAFRSFLDQSSLAVLWDADVKRLEIIPDEKTTVLTDTDKINEIKLAGSVNRQDAWLVAHGLALLVGREPKELLAILDDFPGISRRFEQLATNLYADYAHTPEKIRGALQLGHEVAGDNLVVVYEGLHNTRQHFIRDELATLFLGAKKLYIVPSYLAREDESLELLTPNKLKSFINEPTRSVAIPSELDSSLRSKISDHLASGDTVLALSAGGGGSLDEWLRTEFASQELA